MKMEKKEFYIDFLDWCVIKATSKEEAEEYQRIIDHLMNFVSAESEPEHTMEEFMYGQELGDPEDGSL